MVVPLPNDSDTRHGPWQTTALENANFKLGHIEPGARGGGVMQLKAFGQTAGPDGRKDQIQVRQAMSIEIMLDKVDYFDKLNQAQLEKRLVNRLEQPGHKVTLAPVTAP